MEGADAEWRSMDGGDEAEGEEEAEEEGVENEAVRLKIDAEENYRAGKLKHALKYAKRAQRLCPGLAGLFEMVTALRILRIAGNSAGGSPAWYEILQLEPFSHINSIKKQYKKLALTLHPDKNPSAVSEEAFKLVGEAFRCLSDRIQRKEYDIKLRVAMQLVAAETETFWTVCSTCRLLHQFERRYVGHNLMCPSCKKSFLAVEASSSIVDCSEDEHDKRDANSSMVRGTVGAGKKKVTNVGFKRKMSSVVEVLERARRSTIVWTDSRPNANGVRHVDEITLAEMQLEAKLKARQKNMSGKRADGEAKGVGKKLDFGENGAVVEEVVEDQNLKVYRRRRPNSKQKKSEIVTRKGAKSDDLEMMNVEDSDFYDFDREREERSFKKGQIWAIYEDDDGMPRHYGLIEEVVSVNPFVVNLSWLDLQNKGDKELMSWEALGFHVSCGMFRVGRKVCINSVNVFSHVVNCERAARELYRIYPRKGSVWALYSEAALNLDGRRNPSLEDSRRCYYIVVLLTSYSEIHGLSTAYLEKVEGFRTIFKRKEIGCHAIRWIEKDDVQLLSHEIPARKLSGTEAPDLPKDCWELDPASLPPELLTICLLN